ncbi:hypothetical protein BHE74_00058334 [Ensete ventricosum]|nr:hypothetical protein BHE74_00058334 [Ensete ventricosum]
MDRPSVRVAGQGQAPCKGGQPPCRVGYPRPAPMQGRPPTARPAARGNRLRPRPPTRGRPVTAKALCRGSRRHARTPAGMAGAYRDDAYGRRQRSRPGRKGQPRGQGCCQQGRSLLQGQRPCKVTPPAHEVLPEGDSACCKGDCRRLRRATVATTQ